MISKKIIWRIINTLGSFNDSFENYYQQQEKWSNAWTVLLSSSNEWMLLENIYFGNPIDNMYSLYLTSVVIANVE